VSGIHEELRPDVGLVGRDLELFKNVLEQRPAAKTFHLVGPSGNFEALKKY
jgi:hypothetical protein